MKARGRQTSFIAPHTIPSLQFVHTSVREGPVVTDDPEVPSVADIHVVLRSSNVAVLVLRTCMVDRLY